MISLSNVALPFIRYCKLPMSLQSEKPNAEMEDNVKCNPSLMGSVDHFLLISCFLMPHYIGWCCSSSSSQIKPSPVFISYAEIGQLFRWFLILRTKWGWKKNERLCKIKPKTNLSYGRCSKMVGEPSIYFWLQRPFFFFSNRCSNLGFNFHFSCYAGLLSV